VWRGLGCSLGIVVGCILSSGFWCGIRVFCSSRWCSSGFFRVVDEAEFDHLLVEYFWEFVLLFFGASECCGDGFYEFDDEVCLLFVDGCLLFCGVG